jgi:hypothetical protein
MNKEEKTKKYLATKQIVEKKETPSSVKSVEDFEHFSQNALLLEILSLLKENVSNKYIRNKISSLVVELDSIAQVELDIRQERCFQLNESLARAKSVSNQKESLQRSLASAMEALLDTIKIKNEQIKKLNEFGRADILDLSEEKFTKVNDDYDIDEEDEIPNLDLGVSTESLNTDGEGEDEYDEWSDNDEDYNDGYDW